MLFIGLSDYGYGCHRDRDSDGNQDPHGPNGTPCDPPPDPGGGGGGGDVGEYIVTISTPGGGVESDTMSHWLGHQGEKVIHINNGRNPGTLPFFIDLSFFQNPDNIKGGGTCFEPDVEFLGQLGVLKGGGAVAQFWFDGFQRDFPTIEARYYLTMFGTFDSDGDASCSGPCLVFPVEPGESARMEMMDWELSVQGGMNIQAASCMGESDPDLDPPTQFDPKVVILVQRIN